MDKQEKERLKIKVEILKKRIKKIEKIIKLRK